MDMHKREEQEKDQERKRTQRQTEREKDTHTMKGARGATVALISSFPSGRISCVYVYVRMCVECATKG